MRRGTWRAWGLATLIAVTTAGCGVLPPLPEPVPSEITPSGAAGLEPALGSDPLSPDGFDAVQRMAVRVRNVGCDELSTGSGFAIDKHTLITNKHVVADSSNLQVSTYDGRDIDVGTAATAALADLAIVRTRDALPSFPELAEADPEQGDDVTIIGYPSGGELTISSGLVIGSTRDPLNANLGEVLVTDAKVEPGSSGSAALDSQGRVIGVVYAKTADDDSLLVPISTVREMLSDSAAFEDVTTCTGS
ncbi:S1 family peptidase [Myceligenerans indicum]|uniref:Trypsin-like peptidase domain-containing protein n=1 Tax=Myceligenerans indicum TaxID=2593663 RepID=A0ABS1LKP2_9MICO|nr:serine protease [Myceligenerans indicum]MBL0886784.1 trypsin-like peptidase domain-containing protein [Myceligenerans indicum]